MLRHSVPLVCAASGVAAVAHKECVPTTLFAERREKILVNLREKRGDKSLAGRVDPQVAPLVEFINEMFRCYVTSSSCSGRVSLFHKAQLSAGAADVEVSVAERKRGAFGRGTLFQSHDPFHDVVSTMQGLLIPALRDFYAWREQQLRQMNDVDPVLYESELLELKFEPMILHIQCESMDGAARLLQCASESGQMESGILSCSRGTTEQRKITCCITSSLRVAIPLFAQGRWLLGHATFDNPEWRELLGNTLTHMNALFSVNAARRCRFADELKHRLL